MEVFEKASIFVLIGFIVLTYVGWEMSGPFREPRPPFVEPPKVEKPRSRRWIFFYRKRRDA